MVGAPAPFRAERYELAASHPGWYLSRPAAAEAAALAARLIAMPPLVNYGARIGPVTELVAEAEHGRVPLAIRGPTGEVAGVAVVRQPWLAGPYMQFLTVLPEHQRRGLGTAALAWMEREARSHELRNLWICASDFNAGAERLYARFGFARVALIEDVMVDGISEALMRKSLSR